MIFQLYNVFTLTLVQDPDFHYNEQRLIPTMISSLERTPRPLQSFPKVERLALAKSSTRSRVETKQLENLFNSVVHDFAVVLNSKRDSPHPKKRTKNHPPITVGVIRVSEAVRHGTVRLHEAHIWLKKKTQQTANN